MIADEEVRAALAEVPCIDPDSTTMSPLAGGLSNRVFRITGPHGDFVLRLVPASDPELAPERGAEAAILAAAFDAGLAPEPVHADPAKGILLTRFLPGRSWRQQDLECPSSLERLADLLRRVHALPAAGRPLDVRAAAARYADALDSAAGKDAFAEHCLTVVEELALPARTACCHNDVVAGNVIEHRELKLIDWEYAGDNDPFFDLASLVSYHDLDESCQSVLLSAYTGSGDPEHGERLATVLRAFDALLWLWLSAARPGTPAKLSARLAALRSRIR